MVFGVADIFFVGIGVFALTGGIVLAGVVCGDFERQKSVPLSLE